jgi:deoxycytidylate deaminase
MKKLMKDTAKQQQCVSARILKPTCSCNHKPSGTPTLSSRTCSCARRCALAEKCVAMLQEEKHAVVALAEKEISVLQTLCKKLQAEKEALLQQLSPCVQ